MRSTLLCVLCVLCGPAVSGPSASQDWPAFRGPGGQGLSSERGLPLEWSETKNIAWKTAVPGLGWSSPVIVDGKAWITAAVEQRGVSLRLLAFDVATGREAVNVEVFRIAASREINPKNSWASPTPIVEGDRVYVHFGADGTAAVTTRKTCSSSGSAMVRAPIA